MAYYRNLREHVKALEDLDLLVRVKRPIDKDTELHPLVRWQFRGLEEEQRKAFIFEDVHDAKGKKYEMPVLVGAFAGSHEIYSLGLQSDPEPDRVSELWDRALSNPIPPKMVDTGPVKEVVHKGETLMEHGGLSEFPVPISTPGFDNAPYTTASCWITKDVETGVRNMGIYRAQIKGPLKTGINFAWRNNGSIHWHKCNQRGVPLQAAIVMGGPPCITYSAAQRPPYGVDELAIAGAIARGPIQLVKCETVDLEVPAEAEIVIEGTIPTDVLEPEGPFGEAHGYVDPGDLMPIFNVTCISHRRQPIYPAIISQLTPSESANTKTKAFEAYYLKVLRESNDLKGIKRIVLYDDMCNRQYGVIQMKKTNEYDPWYAMHGLLGIKQALGIKVIVVVDEDIEPSDPMVVNWAIVNRCQPHRDMKIVENRAIPFGPLTYAADGTHYDKKDSALLIDATSKAPLPPVALPTREYMENARKIWEELGLPPLKPKTVWYGYSLGFWPKENEEMSRMAVRGDYFAVGERVAKKAVKVTNQANLDETAKQFHEQLRSEM